MERLTVAVIAGSARDKRESIKAARFVADIGQQYLDIEVIVVDPKDFTFPNDGNDTEGKDPLYTEITARADAFFIVTPEYNHSFPGSLKRMLDSEYENYWHKPVAVAGVSNSAWGGTRAVEGLLPALRTMGLSVLQTSAYFPRVQNIFDEEGRILPEKAEKYTRRVRAEWDELIWMARTLKWGREHLPNPAYEI
jgi:NAD(P)H-dependent FMN reductase